jgi:hypothetical protein
MAEDVDKQLALTCEPGSDLAQKQLIIPNVLEHLDGEHAIELLFEFELGDIARADFHVPQTERSTAIFDELPLAMGV